MINYIREARINWNIDSLVRTVAPAGRIPWASAATCREDRHTTPHYTACISTFVQTYGLFPHAHVNIRDSRTHKHYTIIYVHLFAPCTDAAFWRHPSKFVLDNRYYNRGLLLAVLFAASCRMLNSPADHKTSYLSSALACQMKILCKSSLCNDAR